MSNYLTPDVYTEEVPLLPPSVAAVSTAVPAFMGFTEKAAKNGKDVFEQAIRITTLLEYKEIFGNAEPATFEVEIDNSEVIKNVKVNPPKSTLYHAVDHYFKNGGGDCYIISLGTFDSNYSQEAFFKGLDVISKEDEPTLIMLGEATKLSSSDYHMVCVEALKQCETLKDRFCIFDIKDGEDEVSNFRNGIGTNNLKYGAAYTPYLHTSLNYYYNDADVKVNRPSSSVEETTFSTNYNGIKIVYTGNDSDNPKFRVNGGEGTSVEFSVSSNNLLTISNVPESGVLASDLITAWSAFTDKKGFDLEELDGSVMVTTTPGVEGQEIDKIFSGGESSSLESYKLNNSALYNKIVAELTRERVILPPSAAVAGVYASTDRQRGVWKAPANVSLNSVIGAVEKITSAEQERLNVDSTAGKSINAIRSFTGRGTMVWGARTLAGNDNEWRYVSVRRLFNMIEESTKKASYFAVFEPNDAATWLKVKAMIESFLYGVWQQGGLAGSTEEQAYFVNVGLGKTMTQQDILEGRMIVEIGIAASRPAEFIVLKFSHKLQEV
ncbi:MAG: phage tail sheath subtilisin-like domain-containing protein [Bacteroidales bacterium]|nr:phage tail sheath subtilisin-like domain-containing protein [Bacteroidales bacterium]